MVVSAREEASAIGAAILKKGGNAFDAMIATDLALVVAYPVAGNIGGGGFTVYRTKSYVHAMVRSGSICLVDRIPYLLI